MPHFQVDLKGGFFTLDDYSVAANLEPLILQNLLKAQQVPVPRRFQLSCYLQIAFCSEVN
jgi:hypothetical protein